MKLSKINLIRIITVSVAVVALSTCVIVGIVTNRNNINNTSQTINVEKIEITKKPNKLDYFVGEKFSRAGMVVTAFYNDNSSKKIMNYTIDKVDPLTLNDKEVTITFKEKTAKLAINVTEKQVETQIHVTSDETYTYKVEAENLPFLSEELGTDKTQFYEYHNESTGNPTTSGGVSVGKLNYSGENIFLRVSSEVEAKANIVLSMAFNPSLDFDYSVETKWNDEIITTGFNISVSENAKYVWFDWKEYVIENLNLKKGINELSLRLKDTSKLSPNYDYVKLEVSPVDINKVTGIEIESMPDKVNYIEGEEFDNTGLVVKCVYEDGTKIKINDYSFDKTILKLGDDKVTINYKNLFTAEIPVTVTRASIDRLEIESMPERTDYYAGQKFETKGLIIKAYTIAGSSQDVTSLLTFDKVFIHQGDTKVVATYGDKNIDIPVNVIDKVDLNIEKNETKNYRVEFEDTTFVKGLGCDKEKYSVVDDNNASGNKRLDSLDWLKGSSFMGLIDSKVDTVAKLVIVCDGPGLDYNVTNYMTFNDETISLSENPSGGWLTFKSYIVEQTLNIKKGINTLIINIGDNQSVNFDYYELLINPEIDLEISGDYKTIYNDGENFDNTNMVVEVVKLDGTKNEITDYEIIGGEPLLETDNKIIIKHGSLTKEITINVIKQAELLSISASYNGETTYYAGQEFDDSQLVVTAHYSDETSQIVTDYEIVNKKLGVNNTSVIIKWKNKETKIDVTVKTHLIIDQKGDYRLELEDALFTKGTGDKEKYNVIDDNNASGNKRLDSLDWLKDSTFLITINSKEINNIKIKICCDGGGAGGNINNFAQITLNGNNVEFNSYLQGGWGNLQVISSNETTINEGLNEIVIKITGTGSVNYDYLEISVL